MLSRSSRVYVLTSFYATLKAGPQHYSDSEYATLKHYSDSEYATLKHGCMKWSNFFLKYNTGRGPFPGNLKPGVGLLSTEHEPGVAFSGQLKAGCGPPLGPGMKWSNFFLQYSTGRGPFPGNLKPGVGLPGQLRTGYGPCLGRA
jgi:hypothetical protein